MKTSEVIKRVVALEKSRKGEDVKSPLIRAIASVIPIPGFKTLVQESPVLAAGAVVATVAAGSYATAYVVDEFVRPIFGDDSIDLGFIGTIAKLAGYTRREVAGTVEGLPEFEYEDIQVPTPQAEPKTSKLPETAPLPKRAPSTPITVPKLVERERVAPSIRVPKAPDKIPEAAAPRAPVSPLPPRTTPTLPSPGQVYSPKGTSSGLGSIRPQSQDEASALAALRAQGESFKGGAGLNAEMRAIIKAAARKVGVPEDWMLSMAYFESGGNPNAVSTTGAIGLYQFTGGTARDFGLKNRFDPVANAEAGARLMLSNINSIKNWNRRNPMKVQIPLDLTSVYLAHQMGFGGLLNIHEAIHHGAALTETTKRNMGYNLGVKSPESYLEANRRKMADAASKSSQDVAVSYRTPVGQGASTTVASVERVAPPTLEAPTPTKTTAAGAQGTKPQTQNTASFRPPSGDVEFFTLPNGALAFG